MSIWRHLQIFWRCRVSLVKWLTGPSFMSISKLVLNLWEFFFVKDWLETRKLEIPWSDFWQISVIWHDVSNKMLLNGRKFQGYSFYCFWVTKEKPNSGWGKTIVPPQIRAIFKNSKINILTNLKRLNLDNKSISLFLI